MDHGNIRANRQGMRFARLCFTLGRFESSDPERTVRDEVGVN
jgi:hypothetical protein